MNVAYAATQCLDISRRLARKYIIYMYCQLDDRIRYNRELTPVPSTSTLVTHKITAIICFYAKRKKKIILMFIQNQCDRILNPREGECHFNVIS